MTLWETIGNFFYDFGVGVVTLPRLVCFGALVIGYFFGHIQSAYIFSKIKKVDIYSKGSGNPGTTNMWRVLGPGWGILTFLIDVGKVVGAIFLAKYIFLTLLKMPIDPIAMTLYTGLGAVLGHDFPVLLKGRGGKGVASTAAVFCCIGEWKYIIVGLVVFLVILLITRYVSLSSIIMVIFLMLAFFLFTLINWTYIDPDWLTDCHIIVALLALLNIVAHRQNIVRLACGEENKIGAKRHKVEEPVLEETEEEEPAAEIITEEEPSAAEEIIAEEGPKAAEEVIAEEEAETAEEIIAEEEAEAAEEITTEEEPAVVEETIPEETPAAVTESTANKEQSSTNDNKDRQKKTNKNNKNNNYKNKTKKKHSTTKKKKSKSTKKKRK